MKSPRQGRGYFFLTWTGFLGALAYTVIHPVLPLYVGSFGASYEQVGLFFSAYSLTWAALQIYTGYLAGAGALFQLVPKEAGGIRRGHPTDCDEE